MVDKSAVLSLPIPHCPSLSVEENDYEQRRSQVRVLPSALLFTLQIAEFFLPLLVVSTRVCLTNRFGLCQPPLQVAAAAEEMGRYCRTGRADEQRLGEI